MMRSPEAQCCTLMSEVNLHPQVQVHATNMLQIEKTLHNSASLSDITQQITTMNARICPIVSSLQAAPHPLLVFGRV